MSQDFILSVQGLNLVYANGHQALRNVSFNLAPGHVCALLGMNGSGKSTLFKSILNLEVPTSGSISIAGTSPRQAISKNLIAYVPQADTIDYDFPLSVAQVIMQGRYGHMGLLRRPSARDKELVAQAAARMNLTELLDRQIGQLSGGQKKRVFIARALVQEADLILLDEPFTGVDITTENHIIALLPQLAAEGKTILVSTHNLERVKEYCDLTILLYRTILAYGPTEQVCTPEQLQAAFSARG